MAIFQGEDLIDITTPDGRTMTLPRSLVPSSLMPQQPQIGQQAPLGQPPQEMPAPTLPAPQEDTPKIPVGDGTAMPGATVEMGEPQTKRVSVKQNDQQIAKRQKEDLASQKRMAAYATSPQGQMAGAENKTQGALGNEKEAVLDAASVDAAAQDLLGQASEQHNERIDKLFDDKAKEANERFAAEESKNNDITALRKQIAGTKIDRNADHPILAALSMALAGIGMAMKGQDPGAAVEFFWKALDRKVAAQMSNLDIMEKQYGMSKDELGALREQNGRKLEIYNGMIAGEADKAKRHLEEIIAKSASDKTRASAKIMMAQIDERASAAHQDAVRWGLDYDQKDRHQKQQLNLGYANLAETKRSNMEQAQLKREDMYLDYQKALAADKAKGDEASYKAKLELIKDNETRGIKSVVDKQPLLTAEGRAKMEQAAKLEEDANKFEAAGKADPMSFSVKGGKDRVAMMREKASILRGDAQITGVVRARDPNQAGNISKKWAASQTFMQTVDEINDLYDKAGRSIINKDQLQQELQAKYGLLAVAAKDAWQLGAWDKGSAKLVSDIIGQDPTKGWDTGYITQGMIGQNPEGFRNRLKAVTQRLEQDMENELSTNTTWDDKGKLFSRKERIDPESAIGKASGQVQGATPLGQAEDLRNNDGVAAKAYDTLKFGVGPGMSRDEQARNVEERSGSMQNIGLTDKQASGFNALLKGFKSGNAKAGDQIVAQVLNNATSQPDLSIALVHNLREHAPELYSKVVASLPEGQVADQIKYESNNEIAVAPMMTNMVASNVINTLDAQGKVTDQEGWKELARRAAKNDKDAKKAILDIVNQASYLRTYNAPGVGAAVAPNNSIVKGAR
jgi:hypothetical protein